MEFHPPTYVRPDFCINCETRTRGFVMFTSRIVSRSTVFLIPILLMAAPLSAAELPTLEQVLDRYIAALGGQEALAKLESRTIIGKQVDDRPYKGAPVETPFEARADTSTGWTLVFHEAEGDVGEYGDSGKNTKLAFIFNPRAPLMLEKYFPNPRLTGTWEYDGIHYYKVENDLKFEHYTLYFEVETGTLTRIGYHWSLEDYREVDGVLIPFTVAQGRKGGLTNLYFDSVTHNTAAGGQ